MDQEEIRGIVSEWLGYRSVLTAKIGSERFIPGMLSNVTYYSVTDDDIDSLVEMLEEKINEV